MILPTGNDSHPEGPQSGFTLLELLTVLLILSLVLGLSVPLLNRTFHRLQIEVLSYNVAKLLDYAGKRAVASRNRVRVHFDTENRRYWLLQAPEASSENQYERVADQLGRTYSVPNTVSIEPSRPDATFYPDGSADPFQLLIYDHGRTRYRLVTDVWTGRVSLFTADGD